MPTRPLTRASQSSVTPAEALEMLRDGNRRFLRGDREDRSWLADVRATARGQFPFAFVLGCIDSRVPVESIFDQGIGDILTARIAGNVVNRDLLGSMEFGCKLAGAKAIVVLGHTSCGAVGGAVEGLRMGHLTTLVGKIEPVVASVRERMADADPGLADEVARANVIAGVDQIRSESSVLSEMEASGEVVIAGAMYDVASGEVNFL